MYSAKYSGVSRKEKKPLYSVQVWFEKEKKNEPKASKCTRKNPWMPARLYVWRVCPPPPPPPPTHPLQQQALAGSPR